MEAMQCGGARWAVERGFGTEADLGRIEERGQMPGAEPEAVSVQAMSRHEATRTWRGRQCAAARRAA